MRVSWMFFVEEEAARKPTWAVHVSCSPEQNLHQRIRVWNFNDLKITLEGFPWEHGLYRGINSPTLSLLFVNCGGRRRGSGFAQITV